MRSSGTYRVMLFSFSDCDSYGVNPLVERLYALLRSAVNKFMAGTEAIKITLELSS